MAAALPWHRFLARRWRRLGDHELTVGLRIETFTTNVQLRSTLTAVT
jgi:hypothetical protein